VYDDPQQVPPVDVVLVALKTTANDTLAGVLPSLVRRHEGRDTTVVVLQNGLGVEDRAAVAVPGTTVLGGLCFVCAHRLGPGRVEHLDYGAVTLAEHRPDGAGAGVTAAVEAVGDDLGAAGVDVVRHDDLPLARWRKLVWNVPYNGLSVLLDAGTDELMADAATRGLVRSLMVEVVEGAEAAAGRAIDDGFVDEMLTTTDAMTPYRPSMKLDYDAGRPLELDAIYRAPIEAARAGGLELTGIETLWRQLRFLDRRQRC
jgi:2-dehydropantoate 2-reductase